MQFDAGHQGDDARRRGRRREQLGGVKRVVLGHAHADHRGTAPLHGRARSSAIPTKSPTPKATPRSPPTWTSRSCRWRRCAGSTRCCCGAGTAAPVKIDGTVSEGDEVAGFRVIHFPGHAPGLIGLWRESDRVALVSDVVYLVDSARLEAAAAGRGQRPPPGLGLGPRQGEGVGAQAGGAGTGGRLRRARAAAARREPARDAGARGREVLSRSALPARAAIVSAPDDRDLRLGGADLRRLAAGGARRPRPRGARTPWSWLEPAVGFGAVLTVTGFLARAPGHGDTRDRRPASLLLVAAACWSGGRPYAAPTAVAAGRAAGRDRDRRPGRSRSRSRSAGAGGCSASASTTTSACTWPGPSGCAAASGRRRTPATRWARTGSRSRSPRCPGSASAQAFVGEIFAIGVLTGADRAGGAAATSAPAGGRSPRPSSRFPTSPPPTSPRAPSRRPPRRSSSSPSPSTSTTSTADGPRAPRISTALGRAGGAWPLRCRWRSPAGSSSPTASPGSPGRSRSSASVEPDRARGAAGAARRGRCCGSCCGPAVAGRDRRPRRRSRWR